MIHKRTMKIFLFLFILCIHKHSAGQHNYGYKNDAEMIKRTKVKTLSIYHFINESDSTLTHFNAYDPFGKQLSAKTFYHNGTITLSDTFIYDTNHYLVKTVSTGTHKKLYENTYENDHKGRVLHLIMTGDSVYYESIFRYAKNGRYVESLNFSNKGDTVIIKTWFDRKGLIKKNITTDKKGNSVIEKDGVFTFINKTPPKTAAVTEPLEPAKRYKTLYSYYPNGLTFEAVTFIDDKPSRVEKTFYTYY